MAVSRNYPQDPNELIDLSQITTYQTGMVQAAAHRALKRVTDAALKEYGLTTTQWFIIGAVLDAGQKGIRLTDLAIKAGTTMSFLTNAVNLLASKNILTRVGHDTDSRARLIVVAEEYLPQCVVIEESLRAALRESIYSKVSYEELRIYIAVLYKLKNLN